MDEPLRDAIHPSVAGAPPPAGQRGVRVLVVDSRQPMRDALCDMIRREPRATVAGCADSVGRALALTPSLHPDVILIGVCADPFAVEAGPPVAPGPARGRTTGSSEADDCVRGPGAGRGRVSRASGPLTWRERELVRVIVAHPSAKYSAIADALGITAHTVHNHLTRIYLKLDVKNRSALLAHVMARDAAARAPREGPAAVAGGTAVALAQQRVEAVLQELLQARGPRADARPPSRAEARGVRRRKPDGPLDSLTARERDVLQVLLANPGAKYFTIAAHLGISEHTVHNYLSSIYQKLQVVNRNDLLAYAVRNGLEVGQTGPTRVRA